MTELKSCPFCGGKAMCHPITMDIMCRDLLHTYWRVRCTECGTQIREETDRDKAIATWNRRAEHTATRISVPREGHTAIGHYECGECRGVVGAQDAHCKHCGARLVEP